MDEGAERPAAGAQQADGGVSGIDQITRPVGGGLEEPVLVAQLAQLLQDRSETPPRRCRLGCDAALRGDVLDDQHAVGVRAVGVALRPRRRVRPHQAAARAEAARLGANHGDVPGEEMLEEPGKVLGVLRMDGVDDRAAGELRRRVAEHVAQRGVDRQQAQIDIEGGHAQRAVVEDQPAARLAPL